MNDPTTRTPRIRRLDWDGTALHVATDPHTVLDVAIDGAHYVRIDADANGAATLALPFSPSGHAAFAVGFAAPGLAFAAPVGVRCGEPGLSRAARVPALAPLAVEELADADRLADLERAVAVVVPVYNAPDDVRVCLDSVLAHVRGDTRVIVIDDASPDPAIAPLLAGYADRPGVTVLSNAANRGFTATANRGIVQAGTADVVLLNADTEVAPQWLAGLRCAAYARDDTASATAVSDNAGAFSVPELERDNPLPAGWTFADAARALRQSAGHAYPRLPTGNGFCLYLKRATLDAVGLLDEAAFPQGYGEENDWCQRAAAHGWTHVVAGPVFVRHARSRSFGHERRATLGAAGMQVLRERWPQYEADVGATLFSHERRVLDWRVRRLYAGAVPRMRVLRIGDAVPAVRDESMDTWNLRRDRDAWRLYDADGRLVDTCTHADAEHWAVRWLQRGAFERIVGAESPSPRFARFVQALDIALVPDDA